MSARGLSGKGRYLVCCLLLLTMAAGCGAQPDMAPESPPAPESAPAAPGSPPVAAPPSLSGPAFANSTVPNPAPTRLAGPAHGAAQDAALTTSSAPADPDAPPPAPPLVGIQLGEKASRVHTALVRAYTQTGWTSRQPVRISQYRARDKASPLETVELYACQADDTVVAVRVFGKDARALYEAAHGKYAFRYVERTRDEPGMDPGPGPGMPFARQYADNVVLSLVTTPDGGAGLVLESAPLMQQCTAAGVEASAHMKQFFMEQEQTRTERRRNAL